MFSYVYTNPVIAYSYYLHMNMYMWDEKCCTYRSVKAEGSQKKKKKVLEKRYLWPGLFLGRWPRQQHGMENETSLQDQGEGPEESWWSRWKMMIVMEKSL